MPEVESGSIQFVVTSPPYWNLKKYGDNGLSLKQAYSKYLYQIQSVLKEVKKSNGAGKIRFYQRRNSCIK